MVLKYLLGDSLGPRRYKESPTQRSRVPVDILICVVLFLGIYYALPTLFAQQYYTLQIFPKSLAEEGVQGSIWSTLKDELIAQDLSYYKMGFATVEDKNIFQVRFNDQEEMLATAPYAMEFLGDQYLYSYAKVRSVHQRIKRYGNKPVNLGLDLNGGVHFLMEVDTQAAIRQRIDLAATQMRNLLRKERLRFVSLSSENVKTYEDDVDYAVIELAFASKKRADEAVVLLSDAFEDMDVERWERSGVFYMQFFFPAEYLQQLEDFAIDQNMATLRERINELGVSEPLVQKQGEKRIVVQIPGIQDTVAAKRIIGSTANLEFRLESLSTGSANAQGFRFRDDPQRRAYLERDVIVTGGSVINAQVQYDENNLPQVAITMDTAGGRLMNRATRTNVGRNMAVLLVESRAANITQTVSGETLFTTKTTKEIISLATIRETLGARFVITGLEDQGEASSLALLLRAGALAAPIYFVEERTIGASLGQDNIRRGMLSLAAGLVAVMLFILFYYKLAGVFANIAVLLNLLLILAIMSQLSAVLTLPGIAGIVLTVGMAVDANILIFSRIKEEMKQGLQSMAAINAGYDRAFVTILDANITTLLVAIILFAIGTGPIKGFAITLSIGLLCSLFTSIVVTRRMMEWVYAPGRLSKISI